MKLGLTYLAGAVLLALIPALVQHPLVIFLFGWPALSLLLVSAAYLGNYPNLFRKRSDGSIPLYIKVFFVPFLMGAHLINRRHRQRDSLPSFQQIENNLYVGSRLMAADMDRLREANICAVLDVTCEFDGLNWSAQGDHLDYLNVPILDHAVPRISQLNQCINWIHHHVIHNRPVLIHCALGRGRSVLVLAAYLLCRNLHGDLQQVHHYIQQSRTTARLNRRQFRVLAGWYRDNKLLLKQRMALVINPGAGSMDWGIQERQVLDLLESYFDLKIFPLDQQTDLNTALDNALSWRPDILTACGGDGTVAAAGDRLAGTDTALGIIPLGTANALAFALFGLNSKLDPIQSACDILIKGARKRIDTALCNNRRMLLLAGYGLEEQMAENAAEEAKERWGQMAYIFSFVSALINLEPSEYQLELDDGEPEFIETRSLTIANAAPLTSILARGGGAPKYTDGQLDITWIRRDSLIPEGVSLLELLTGSAAADLSTLVEHRQASCVRIRTSSPQRYVVDGEINRSDCLEIKVDPQSLTVIAPLDKDY